MLSEHPTYLFNYSVQNLLLLLRSYWITIYSSSLRKMDGTEQRLGIVVFTPLDVEECTHDTITLKLDLLPEVCSLSPSDCEKYLNFVLCGNFEQATLILKERATNIPFILPNLRRAISEFTSRITVELTFGSVNALLNLPKELLEYELILADCGVTKDSKFIS
jgi:hypothetical protein